jgi:hypothetical protein
MSKTAKEDPATAFPSACAAAVSFLRAVKTRNAGGLHFQTPILSSVAGVASQVQPFATAFEFAPTDSNDCVVCRSPLVQDGTNAEFVNMLTTAFKMYASKVDEALAAQVAVQATCVSVGFPTVSAHLLCLQTGEALVELGETKAAIEHCFCRAEISEADGSLAKLSPERLTSHVRAVFGRCVSTAKAAVTRDPRINSPVTLQQLLASLARLQQAMQAVTDRPMDVRECLYWLVYNGSVHVFALCEVLITFGYGSYTVPYLSWILLAHDATPNLCTMRYIGWRIRVFLTVAKALEQSGDVTGAVKAMKEAHSRISRLRRELSVNPPIPSDVEASLQAYAFQLNVAGLRLELLNESTAAAAISGMSAKFPAPEQAVYALVQAISPQFNRTRRLLQHSKPSAEEAARLNRVLPALMPLVAASMESANGILRNALAETAGGQYALDTTADGVSTVAALSEYEATCTVPVHTHVALLRVLFTFEKWQEFVTLLPPAEARVALAIDRISPLAGDAVAASSSKDLSNLQTLRVFATELKFLRAVYELEVGEIPDPLSTSAEGAHIDTSAASSADEDADVDTSLGGRFGGLKGAESFRASSGKLPGADVRADRLDALSQLTFSVTKGDAAVFCTARGDVVIDAIKVLWKYSQRLSAWLDGKDVGLARSRTNKRLVRSANIHALRAIHFAAMKVGALLWGVATIALFPNRLLRCACVHAGVS